MRLASACIIKALPSKLKDAIKVPIVPAAVIAAEKPVPIPAVPNSHLTAVSVTQDCVVQSDGCIRMDAVQSTVTKLTPATVTAVNVVTAALGLSKPLTTGA